MSKKSYTHITQYIRETFGSKPEISLHEPVFNGREKEYLLDCIDSTFVSYVGKYVSQFEEQVAHYCGAKFAVATSSGTSALHIALLIAGVQPQDEVITQSLTFVATANAISYCQATPLFVDSNKATLGMDPDSLEAFLADHAEIRDDGLCYNKDTGNILRNCLPVHIFGHPVMIDRIIAICNRYNITVIEDAAESLGSTFSGSHMGTMGKLGVLSFNGNKILTTGGGGMIITNDEELAKKALHLTTTAKNPHPWDFTHSELAYNYRMPNVNAAIGCAQLEQLDLNLENKRELASSYQRFCGEHDLNFVMEPENCRSNYWLNAIVLENRNERDNLLTFAHKEKIFLRPAWTLMSELDMYKNCESTDLSTAIWLQDRLVNLPSSVRL